MTRDEPQVARANAAPAFLPLKLFRPARDQDTVTRSRLIEVLNAARGSALVLVSAPAGSGKTTLVADWSAGVDVPVAWISLDPADDDPATFLSCLVAALESVAPGAAATAHSMLQSVSPPHPLEVARALLADVTSSGAAGIVVLDDYHVISDSDVHSVVTLLAERGSAGITVVIISRSDPPLPLARLRVRRKLCEVRAADLRFRADEAAELMRVYSHRELRPAALEALTARTEGWAAGLQLAGLALRDGGDADRFAADFQGTHAYVADYLTDEVLRALDVDDERFLVATSLLDRFCGALCDAMLGYAGGGERLERLFRSNLFLVPLDAERRWFRFHHLFGDLLRRRSDVVGREEQNALLARASLWCEEHGVVNDAVSLADRAGDSARVGDLIAQNGIQALAEGRAFTALKWLKRVPASVMAESPDHIVITALAGTLAERYGELGARGHLAARLLAERRRPHPFVDAVELHTRLVIAGADQLDGRPMEPILGELTAVARDAALQSLPAAASAQLMAGNLLRLNGAYAAAESANRAALSLGAQADSDLLRLAAVTGMAENQLLAGDLHRAIATAGEELQRPQRQHEVLGAQLANIAAVLAFALLESDDVEGAEAALARARNALGLSQSDQEWPPAARLGHVVHGIFHSLVPAAFNGSAAFAGVMLRRGEVSAALRWVAAADAALPVGADVPRVLLDWLRTRCLIATGDTASLQRASAGDVSAAVPVKHWDSLRRLTEARRALALGVPAAALEVLAPVLVDGQSDGRSLVRSEAAILHAVGCAALGRRDEAARAVDVALEATAGGGHLRPWLDCGAVVVPLLERAVDRARVAEPALAHAAQLLQRLRQAPTSAQPPVGLTDREVAVLRLISAGHSNQQIGDALFLAVGTVKKHTHNIYAKLNVTNRTQAAQAARDLGLIGDNPVEMPLSPE